MSGLSRWTKREDGYTYEKHSYHVPEKYVTFQWNKSSIKQFLAYIGFSDSKGKITFLSEMDLANQIQCSVRTIQENNKRFEDAGVLKWNRIWGEYIELSIDDYMENVLDLTIDEEGKKHSRTGYTTVLDDVLNGLFGLNNVNAIRVALRALFSYEKEVNLQRNTEAVLSYQEIKSVLPSYLGYKLAIKRLTDTIAHIFNIECLDGTQLVKSLMQQQVPKQEIIRKAKDKFVVSLYLDSTKDSRRIKQKERVESFQHFFSFNNHIRSYVSNGGFKLPNYQVEALSDEYGSIILNKSLSVIKDKIIEAVDSSNHHALENLKENYIHHLKNIANGYLWAKKAS